MKSINFFILFCEHCICTVSNVSLICNYKCRRISKTLIKTFIKRNKYEGNTSSNPIVVGKQYRIDISRYITFIYIDTFIDKRNSFSIENNFPPLILNLHFCFLQKPFFS